MKQQWIILRTLAAVAIIFASGVWVGHILTEKKARDLVVEIAPPENLSPGRAAPRQRLKPAQRNIVDYYQRALSLDNNQFKKFVELFLAQQEELAQLPKHVEKRTEKVRSLHEAFRPFLNPSQHEALDKIMSEVESKKR